MKFRIGAGLALCGMLTVLLAPADAAKPPRLRFTRPVDLPESAGSKEPSLVIDSKGRIFVSAIFGLPGHIRTPGTPVWRSVDGGRNFTKHSTASAGPAATVLGGGDSALVLDQRDYVYATDLWLGNDSISISTDHGTSWLGGPVSHRMVGDRNWLAYSQPSDAIYQYWNGIDGLWVARADLGTPVGEKAALHFANNFRVAGYLVGAPGTYARACSCPPGGIAVDPREGDVWVTWADQQGLAFAKSGDEGLTWTLGHIPDSSVTGETSDAMWNFAPVAVDQNGHVYIAWSTIDGGTPTAPKSISVRLATSRDGGRTWRVRKISQGYRTAVFPTLALYGPDRVAVAWVETRNLGNPNSNGDFGDARWQLQYAEVTGAGANRPRVTYATVDPDVHEGSVFVGPQGGDRGMGDFFSMAVAPNGTLVVAYTRGQAESNNSRISTLLPHGA